MSSYEREPRLLSWDSEHFGMRIASFGPEEEKDVGPALKWCRTNKMDMIMARCESSKAAVVHSLERKGFLLMDTYVRYAATLERISIPSAPPGLRVRSFRREEIIDIETLAQRAFHGFSGHFHRDERLPRRKCDQLYAAWARNSCEDRRLADDVLVAIQADRLLGFSTFRHSGSGAAEAALFAVDPAARGKGVLRAILSEGMRLCVDRGLHRLDVNTQVENLPVHRACVRLGFDMHASGHTFHRWLTSEGGIHRNAGRKIGNRAGRR